MHGSACGLITDSRSEANPSTIGTISCLNTGFVIGSRCESRDAGALLPIAFQCFERALDAGIDGSIVRSIEFVVEHTFWQRVDTNHIAITHLIIFRHGVCTDVVSSGRGEVVHHVDVARMVQIARRTVVGNSRFWICGTVAEALFQNRSGRRDGATTESNTVSHSITWVRHHRWCSACARCGFCGKNAVLGILHSRFQRRIGRLHLGRSTA